MEDYISVVLRFIVTRASLSQIQWSKVEDEYKDAIPRWEIEAVRQRISES